MKYTHPSIVLAMALSLSACSQVEVSPSNDSITLEATVSFADGSDHQSFEFSGQNIDTGNPCIQEMQNLHAATAFEISQYSTTANQKEGDVIALCSVLMIKNAATVQCLENTGVNRGDSVHVQSISTYPNGKQRKTVDERITVGQYIKEQEEIIDTVCSF